MEKWSFPIVHLYCKQKRPGIVLEAEFQLQIGERERIVSVMQKNKDYRRETQPWNHPCAGSVFRNPIPYFAGDLIERRGFGVIK